MSSRSGTQLDAAPAESLEAVATPAALEFLAELLARFEGRRSELLANRARRREDLRSGRSLDFLAETEEIRASEWTVAEPRDDYADRRVEITGPPDRKMMINALNSGARGFMVDFEDATSPTWENIVGGQRNVIDAVRREIAFDDPSGRHYGLAQSIATLVFRPRGLHLPETHIRAAGQPTSGAFVDFGLFVFHNGRELLERGSAAYLYIPKLEHYLEARLWNEVFAFAEDYLDLPRGAVRATVLIETLPAAFQMDEILWELRDHSYGLNAGRWDYIFSAIKTFPDRPDCVLPDRGDITMTVPFMQAYAERVVATCHRRGTFAMGGMAALIPSRRDAEANQRAVAAVGEDKRREAAAGFDGTWVAHPDLVAVARAEFDDVLGTRPNQIDVQPAFAGRAGDLLDLASTPGQITQATLRNDVYVALRYVAAWLSGLGAVGINDLMEDAATAEICRAQVWQWMTHGTRLDDGRVVDRPLVRALLIEEVERITAESEPSTVGAAHLEQATAVFEECAMADRLPEFLTLVAYEALD